MVLDRISLICSTNKELNYKRRENIKPDLQADYKLLCSPQVPITQLLFGDDLQADMSNIKAASKLTQSLSKQSAFSGKQPAFSGKQQYVDKRPKNKSDFYSRHNLNTSKRGKPSLGRGRKYYPPHR